MRLLRVDQTLELCESHLSSTSAQGTEIEILLTRSLLVLICSEFEQAIESIIQERCSSINDIYLREFIGSCVDAVFRSVKSNEIAGLLNRFGKNYKETFKKKTDENPTAVTFYNNIVINRHSFAHAEGGNVTFMEVKKFYEEGHVVLDFFRDTLLVDNITVLSPK